jgi:hypothetical protein
LAFGRENSMNENDYLTFEREILGFLKIMKIFYRKRNMKRVIQTLNRMLEFLVKEQNEIMKELWIELYKDFHFIV